MEMYITKPSASGKRKDKMDYTLAQIERSGNGIKNENLSISTFCPENRITVGK